jgi:hypothetical protein
MVVVANSPDALAALAGRRSKNFTTVAGSNEEAEFSAYEEGLQVVLDRTTSAPNVWLIVNDRLPTYSVRQLGSLNPGLLELVDRLEVAPAHVWPLARPIDVWQYRLTGFLSSHWVLLSAAALGRLGSLRSVTMEEYATHVPTDFPGSWPLSQWLGNRLGEYIANNLTKPQGWSRAEPLTAAAWPVLRLKALSVLNEKLLSARLVEAGVPMVPWRQARAMSQLDPGTNFAGSLVNIYKYHPERGPGMEMSPRARVYLSAAIVAARAGRATASSRLLSSATDSGELALTEWRSRKLAAQAI